jgi:FKBP-type peptidyl-prolyl cis-trans isomerase FkpA
MTYSSQIVVVFLPKVLSAKRDLPMNHSLRQFIALLAAVLPLLGFAAKADARDLKYEKTVRTKSGLKYEDLKVGTGQKAKAGDTVTVHYTGWLKDGKKLDSSLDRGQPFEFKLGAGWVIRGWDEGVQGMKVGGKRKLIVPPHLAYGQRGAGLIPANAELTFDVELLKVQ